jgi:hypothetical protein
MIRGSCAGEEIRLIREAFDAPGGTGETLNRTRVATERKANMESPKASKLSRRKFVQRSVLAGAASSLLPTVALAEKSGVSVPIGPNLYEKKWECDEWYGNLE